MDLSVRVQDQTFICGVSIIKEGNDTPSVVENSQRFFDSFVSGDRKRVYNSISKAIFSSKAKNTPAGLRYENTLTIYLPNGDKNRSVRINQLSNPQFVLIQLTIGQSIVMGRNDYFQNAKPRFEVDANQNSTRAIYRSSSIYSVGFALVGGSFNSDYSDDYNNLMLF